MGLATTFTQPEPTRAEVDALPGLTVLEFGTGWCGHCQRAQPLIHEALAPQASGLRHLKIEDGKGRLLGRSFAVRQWPTLVVLHDGQERARVVRPQTSAEITQALTRATPA